MMLVILEGLSFPIRLEHALPLSYGSLRSELKKTHQLDLTEFSVYLSGRLLSDESTQLDSEHSQSGYIVLRVQSRVLGGKGGFGSQLKAIGAQIQKTTSREACRDLSGRRIRDVNAEKRLGQLAREERRRAEERREQQLRRRERRWAQRAAPPKLEDPVYYQSLEDNENRVSAALKHAQQANGKRVVGKQQSNRTKRPVFKGMEGDVSDSGSDEDLEKSISSVIATSPQIDRDVPDDPYTELAKIDRVSEEQNYPTSPLPTSSFVESDLHASDEPLVSKEAVIPEIEPAASLPEPIDLESVTSKQDLEKFSLEILKITLMSFGLKCGGTLQERIDRLFTYKVTPKDQLPPSIFAGKGKAPAKKVDQKR